MRHFQGNEIQLLGDARETKIASQRSWNLKKAVVELERAGFHVKEQRAESAKPRSFDIEAIVYYLKAIPWEIPEFNRKDTIRSFEK